MPKNSVLAIALSSIATTSVSGTYTAINSNGLPHPCIIIKITNNSDQDVTVSYDGSTDQEFIPKGSALLLNFQTGSLPQAKVAEMAKGTKVYVKGTAGMSGSIYLSGYYQPAGD